MNNWFGQFEIHTREWKDEIRGLEVDKYFEGISSKIRTDYRNVVEYGYVKKHMIVHRLEFQNLITTSTRTSFNDLWEDARKIEKIVAKTETVLVEQIRETVDAIKKPLKCYNCMKKGHIVRTKTLFNRYECTNIFHKSRIRKISNIPAR